MNYYNNVEKSHNETRLIQKNKFCLILFTWNSETGKANLCYELLE